MAATSTTAPARTKSGRCQVCDVDVNLKRGKVADHPAKGRPKETCNGSGLSPMEAVIAGDPGVTVVDPTLDHALIAAARPDGAWSGAEAATINPALCDPDANNPRGELTGIDDLALSLVAQGMLEPIIVTPGPTDGRYTIVAGHRRVAAAIAANLPEIPALVRADLTPGSGVSLAAQIVENLHRVPLTPFEEARAYDLLRDLGMKQGDIATAVGVNQGQVSKRLALLKLPADIAARVGTDAPDAIDVATAVDMARLEPAALAEVTADLGRRGTDPEGAVRRARQNADKAAAHAKVVDDLEAAGVALVDFPTNWFWGVDRYDRPLATGPDGNRQPYAGARTIEATYADHTAEPCHGATVSPRDEVVYVCLDPTRHGYPTPEQEAETAEADAAAADAEREASLAAAAAALAARADAARATALADVKRPQMADTVASWVVALVGDDVAHEVGELVLDLCGWSDIDDPEQDLDEDGVRAALMAELVDRHGALRVAFMSAVADVEDRLANTYYRNNLAGTQLAADHFARLVEFGGYELTDADRAFLAPRVDDLPVVLPAEEPPAGALAWYQPTLEAFDDGDVPRWIVDPGELAAITEHVPDRLILVETAAADVVAGPVVSADGEETNGDDASLSDPGDAAGAPVDPPADESNVEAGALGAKVGDLGDRVPGEMCPASRRRFNLAGSAEGVPCPECGAPVSTTAKGFVRDHDVPEPVVAAD